MFEQTFIATQKTTRERAIALALFGQTLVVTGLGLLPLFGVQPLAPLKHFDLLPPVQVTRAVEKPMQATPPRNVRTLPRVFLRPSVVPLSLQDNRVVNVDQPAIPGLMPSNLGATTGIPFAGPGEGMNVAPPLRPAPEVKPAQRVRLTSSIAQSQLVYGPKPLYPHLAILSRSEGTVKLQAVISREGKIENLHALNGPAMLIAAAMDAVRLWRYRPLLLNGEPAEVITEIDVVFTLQR